MKGPTAHLASTVIMDWTLLGEMDSTFESRMVQRWKREGNKEIIFVIWPFVLKKRKGRYLKYINTHAR